MSTADNDKQFDQQVRHLKRLLSGLSEDVEKRIFKRAIRKGMVVIQESIKAAIPEKYKHLRDVVGSRFAKGKVSKVLEAKAGMAVGIKRKVARASAADTKAKRKKPGVGISANNIHWLTLGTLTRETGKTSRKQRDGTRTYRDTGNKKANRGAMPAVLKDVVPRGFSASSAQAFETMADVTRKGIASYVKRMARIASAGERDTKRQGRVFAKAARSAGLKKGPVK